MSDEPKEGDFDLHVGGIEDGMLLVLQNTLPYVKELAHYGGEQILKAIDELTPRMPLVLVSYGDGEDIESPPTAPLPGEPRVFKHICTFTVICCSGDPRGDSAQRRGKTGSIGAYRMITDVKDALDCKQFTATIGGRTFPLNIEPLKPAGIEYITRLPQLTAYAVHFDTYFKYRTPDRTQPGELVQELIFEVTNDYEKVGHNRPGVYLR